jgi:hypothetical protein
VNKTINFTVLELSNEFRALKKLNAPEVKFDEWRETVYSRFGRKEGRRLLQLTREHVMAVEAAYR